MDRCLAEDEDAEVETTEVGEAAVATAGVDRGGSFSYEYAHVVEGIGAGVGACAVEG